MTKSADQEHAPPSSSFPAYVFEGPAQVAIRTRTNDQPKYVDTRLSVWTWYDGGMATKIDWAALHLNHQQGRDLAVLLIYAIWFARRAPEASARPVGRTVSPLGWFSVLHNRQPSAMSRQSSRVIFGEKLTIAAIAACVSNRLS